MTPEYTYIDTPAALATFTQAKPTVFGFDTEFTHVRTFNPIPELLQIGTEQAVGIIDLRANLPMDALGDWFQDPAITRIAYSVFNDVNVLSEVFRSSIGRIEDIQLALKFLSSAPSVGYDKIIAQYFGEEIDKSMQRSEWDKRPLAPEQLDYAALDVVHLRELWEIVRRDLEAMGRFDWYSEECGTRTNQPHADDPTAVLGKSIHILELDERGFHMLQLLEDWRTQQARQSGIPKNWILETKTVAKLAGYKRLSDKKLMRLLSPKQVRRYRWPLMDLQRRARHAAQDSNAIAPNKLVDFVRALRQSSLKMAEELDLSSDLLASQKDLLFALRAYLQTGALPDWFTAWRTGVIGELVAQTGDEIRQTYQA